MALKYPFFYKITLTVVSDWHPVSVSTLLLPKNTTLIFLQVQKSPCLGTTDPDPSVSKNLQLETPCLGPETWPQCACPLAPLGDQASPFPVPGWGGPTTCSPFPDCQLPLCSPPPTGQDQTCFLGFSGRSKVRETPRKWIGSWALLDFFKK